jgi:hypothetical protein
MPDPVKELSDLLRELDVPIKFGLRAQGHLPRVREMVAQGMPWGDIGRAIGWQGEAVREWFGKEDFADQMLTADRSRIRRELLAWTEAASWFGATGRVLGASDFRAALDKICPEAAE